MSVTAYVGKPGHGKTYQVVSEVIIKSLLLGRRIITNIPLIKDEIDDYLYNHASDNDDKISDFGEFFIVDYNKIVSPDFFPSKKDIEHHNYDSSFIKAGDVVVLDEAWEVFGTGDNLNKNAFEFLRYHRHHPDPESGITSDIVILTQDLMDISPKVRRVIEMTVLTIKAKELGTNKAYRIEIYDSANLRSKPSSVRMGVFNSDIYKLYKSYDTHKTGVKALEVRVDSRQSIFTTFYFKYTFPFLIIVAIFLVYYTYNFITEGQERLNKKPIEQPIEQPIENFNNYRKLRDSEGNEVLIPRYQNHEEFKITINNAPVSKDKSVIGYFLIDNIYLCLIDLGNNHTRIIKINLYEKDKYIFNHHYGLSVLYNGELISEYSGNFRGRALSGGLDSITRSVPNF